MKRKFVANRLIIPLIVAFLLIAPLLSAAVIGEHRYENRHPHYLDEAMQRLLQETPTPQNTEENENEPVALLRAGGKTQTFSVLVLGKDSVAGLTDVIMLATLDTQAHTVQVLQLPRDTYAAYTEGSYRKLNGAYRKLGGEGMADFLAENLGIPVDRYLCMDLSALGEMVDTIGGVHIDVPADMDYEDPQQNLYIHLKAGEQCLDGTQAQAFVRFRSGYAMADIGRMDAQKVFLSALARETKESLTLPQLLSLANTVFHHVKTNLTLSECLTLVREARKVELQDMHFASLPGHSARLDGGKGACYYVMNREATEQLLAKTVKEATALDPNEVFCREDKPAVSSIYHKKATECPAKDYSAREALEGDISVRRIS